MRPDHPEDINAILELLEEDHDEDFEESEGTDNHKPLNYKYDQLREGVQGQKVRDIISRQQVTQKFHQVGQIFGPRLIGGPVGPRPF